MKYPTLPQVCCRCRQFKMPDQGRFIKSRHIYSRWLWRCSTCEDSTVQRQHRKREESPYEKIVREALQVACARFAIKAEYQLGPYYFDFAIPELNLLLEIDPHSTHSSVGRKIRDGKKTKLAEENGWKIVRLVPSSRHQLAREAVNAVWKRYREFIPDAKQVRTERRIKHDDQAPIDRLIGQWQWAFRHFYHMQAPIGDGDVRAAESFLKAHPDVGPNLLIKLVWNAWRRAQKRPKRYPACHGATSMKYFFDHIRDVVSEVRAIRIKGLDGEHRGPTRVSDSDEKGVQELR